MKILPKSLGIAIASLVLALSLTPTAARASDCEQCRVRTTNGTVFCGAPTDPNLPQGPVCQVIASDQCTVLAGQCDNPIVGTGGGSGGGRCDPTYWYYCDPFLY